MAAETAEKGREEYREEPEKDEVAKGGSLAGTRTGEVVTEDPP